MRTRRPSTTRPVMPHREGQRRQAERIRSSMPGDHPRSGGVSGDQKTCSSGRSAIAPAAVPIVQRNSRRFGLMGRVSWPIGDTPCSRS